MDDEDQIKAARLLIPVVAGMGALLIDDYEHEDNMRQKQIILYRLRGYKRAAIEIIDAFGLHDEFRNHASIRELIDFILSNR